MVILDHMKSRILQNQILIRPLTQMADKQTSRNDALVKSFGACNQCQQNSLPESLYFPLEPENAAILWSTDTRPGPFEKKFPFQLATFHQQHVKVGQQRQPMPKAGS